MPSNLVSMFRALLVVGILALAAAWVAPSWNSDERTLELRLREPEEVLAAVRAGVRFLGEEVVRQTQDEEAPSRRSVGAGIAPRPSERLTTEDRERLDQLVEDSLRDR